MSLHTIKMFQIPIEINANPHFPQIWHDETSSNLTQCCKCQPMGIMGNIILNL